MSNKFKLSLIAGIVLTLLLVATHSAQAECANGTSGDDLIVCEETTDGDVSGGPGNDAVVNEGTTSGDVEGNDGDDLVGNTGTAVNVEGGDGDDIVGNTSTGTATGDVSGGNGNDIVANEGTVTGDVEGNNGDDVVANTGTATNVTGGDGNDLVGNAGVVVDSLSGGHGNDLIENSGVVGDDISGGTGDDNVVNSGTVTDDMLGSDGDDVLASTGTVGGDVNAGNGNDVILVSGGVGGVINAGNGDDSVAISDGASQTDGGSLLIIGGNGNDKLVFDLTGDPVGEDEIAQAILDAQNGATSGCLTYGGIQYCWTGFEELMELVAYIRIVAETSVFNPRCYDNFTSMVVYCQPDGSIEIYRLDAPGGSGIPVGYIPTAPMDAAPGTVLMDQTDADGYRTVAFVSETGRMVVQIYAPGATIPMTEAVLGD